MFDVVTSSSHVRSEQQHGDTRPTLYRSCYEYVGHTSKDYIYCMASSIRNENEIIDHTVDLYLSVSIRRRLVSDNMDFHVTFKRSLDRTSQEQ